MFSSRDYSNYNCRCDRKTLFPGSSLPGRRRRHQERSLPRIPRMRGSAIGPRGDNPRRRIGKTPQCDYWWRSCSDRSFDRIKRRAVVTGRHGREAGTPLCAVEFARFPRDRQLATERNELVMTVSATVKFPLIGTPLPVRALLGTRTTVIADSINRPAEIKIRFLCETEFRNMVTSSVKSF